MTNLSKLAEKKYRLDYLRSHYQRLVERLEQLELDAELFRDQGGCRGLQVMWEYTMSMEAEARAMFDCIKADVQETGKKSHV